MVSARRVLYVLAEEVARYGNAPLTIPVIGLTTARPRLPVPMAATAPPAISAQMMLAPMVRLVPAAEAAEVAPPEYRPRSYSERDTERKTTPSIEAFLPPAPKT